MAKKSRSAKGVMVDFDLMDIKSQISSTPKTIEVTNRENFIDEKLRRRLQKAKRNLDNPKLPTSTEYVDPVVPATEEPQLDDDHAATPTSKKTRPVRKS